MFATQSPTAAGLGKTTAERCLTRLLGWCNKVSVTNNRGDAPKEYDLEARIEVRGTSAELCVHRYARGGTPGGK